MEYKRQEFVKGLRLEAHHLIAMEDAIIEALKGVPTASMGSVTLPAAAWTGTDPIYSQAVSCSGVTANSRIDLLPSPEQLRDLLTAEVSLVAANSDGAITVFAIGGTPIADMTIQIMITEVNSGVTS